MGTYIEGEVNGTFDFSSVELEFGNKFDLDGIVEVMSTLFALEELDVDSDEEPQTWKEAVDLHKQDKVDLESILEDYIRYNPATLMDIVQVGDFDSECFNLANITVKVRSHSQQMEVYGAVTTSEQVEFCVPDFTAKISVWQDELDFLIKSGDFETMHDYGELSLHHSGYRSISIQSANFEGEIETGEPYSDNY